MPMSNPGADLLSLGVHLFEAEAEAVRADAAFDEIHNQILENVETVATWPADAEQWTRENTEAYVKALRQFRGAAGEPYTVASKTMNKAWARYDAIAAAIRASNPKTPKGLVSTRWCRRCLTTANQNKRNRALFNSRSICHCAAPRSKCQHDSPIPAGQSKVAASRPLHCGWWAYRNGERDGPPGSAASGAQPTDTEALGALRTLADRQASLRGRMRW